MPRPPQITYTLVALLALVAVSGSASAQRGEPFPGLVALPESSRLRHGEGGESDFIGPEIQGTVGGKLLVTYIYPYLILDDVTAPGWQVLEHFAINAATQMSCDPQADGRSTISKAWADSARTVMVLEMAYRCELSDSAEWSTFVVQLPAADDSHGWRPHKRKVQWLQLEDRFADLKLELQQLRDRPDSDTYRDELADWKKRCSEFLAWWEPRFPKNPILRKVQALRASK